MENKLNDISTIKTFLKSNRPEFVIQNNINSNNISYKLVYTGIGDLKHDTKNWSWRVFSSSKLIGTVTMENQAFSFYNVIGEMKGPRDTYKEKKFQTLINYLHFLFSARAKLPNNVQFLHLGKCSRCGRILKDPTSIERGIGSKCINKD